jgi:hypothetical protein
MTAVASGLARVRHGTTHARLMGWCPRAVTGMHLWVCAAAEAGLFAELGLDVEIVPAAVDAPAAVAAGDADFALTSAVHLLSAQSRLGGRLPVRFVAVFHQRDPISAVVRRDFGLEHPRDLAGMPAARWSYSWFADAYAGALDYLRLEAPVLVDWPGGLDEALGSGAVAVLPMWVDDTAPAHALGMRLYHAGNGFDVRTIALDIPVYSTGLTAADRVPLDVVRRMRTALGAAHELHRAQPEPGLAGFRRRYPHVSEEHARTSWGLYEQYAFDGAAPGEMRADRWAATIPFLSRTHGVAALAPERVYRPELLSA